ncbi:MAG: hypothetical protein JG769_1795 [Oscillospiraceae bacterium]|jgi:hypothetical protein|nr:hypothetical protein [Oscillospiraceae bacterium]
MNMKKAIAGVFAGAVAISAVATTMASAKTVSYAAIDKTFELSGVKGYKASDYAKTTTKFLAKDGLKEEKATSGVAADVTITASDNVNYVIELVNVAGVTTPVAHYESDTKIEINAADVTALTTTDIETALNKLKNVFDVSGTPNGLANGTVWNLTTTTTTTTVVNKIDKDVSAADTLTLSFSQSIANFKITFDAAGTYGDVTLSEAKPDENDNDGILMSADSKVITIQGITLPADSYSVSMSYDVKAPDSSVFKYKSEAQKANPNKTVTVSATATDVVTGTGTTTLFEAMRGLVDSFEASFEVKSADGSKYLEIVESNDGSYKSAASVLDWTSGVKDGVLKNGEDVVDAVSEAIEGRLKAQVIFNFDDPKWDDDDTTYVTVWFKTADFGILKKTVKMDTSNWTATVDWADIVKSATSGTSTLGDVSNKIEDIRVAVDSEDENGSKIYLKSITVKGPAESAEVLSAGESVSDTTAAITSATAATAATTTAAATEATTTTAAASNPKTGNAPVALAVIPVAIAAAAIIAKKRG